MLLHAHCRLCANMQARVAGSSQLICRQNLGPEMPRYTGQEADEVMVEKLQEGCYEDQLNSKVCWYCGNCYSKPLIL